MIISKNPYQLIRNLRYVEKSGILGEFGRNNYSLTATQIDDVFKHLVTYLQEHVGSCFCTENSLKNGKRTLGLRK